MGVVYVASNFSGCPSTFLHCISACCVSYAAARSTMVLMSCIMSPFSVVIASRSHILMSVTTCQANQNAGLELPHGREEQAIGSAQRHFHLYCMGGIYVTTSTAVTRPDHSCSARCGASQPCLLSAPNNQDRIRTLNS